MTALNERALAAVDELIRGRLKSGFWLSEYGIQCFAREVIAIYHASEPDAVAVERAVFRPFTNEEIIHIGKAIMSHLSNETTCELGAISYDVSAAVMRIIQAREAGISPDEHHEQIRAKLFGRARSQP